MSERSLRKVKLTKSAGLELVFDMLQERDGAIIRTEHSVKSKKDQPSPDFRRAMDCFEEVVRYDEGYTKKHEIEITGITFFPSNEAWIITHVKNTISGRTARNSGRISLNSEEFAKTDECESAWEALQEEVRLYLDEGKRAQLTMAFTEEDADVPEEKHVDA
jgi:hypothetical protein